MGTGIPGPADSDPESVASALGYLRNSLEDHAHLLAQLREKITPILRPCPVNGETGERGPASVACQVASTIQEQVAFVKQMNRNVIQMLESVGL